VTGSGQPQADDGTEVIYTNTPDAGLDSASRSGE
jgi:hypothetical protein